MLQKDLRPIKTLTEKHLEHFSTFDNYDLKNTVQTSRLKGLWRMMSGFHLPYLGANLSLGHGCYPKNGTFLLLRYFVDQVLGVPKIAISCL